VGNVVYALAASATGIYVGGGFTNVAGIATADYLARWNGTAWSAVGSDGSGGGALNGFVNALAVTCNNVYVGGQFTDAAGLATADHVAGWNGSTWSALGSNGAGDGALNSVVFGLAAGGSKLYAGGQFSNASGIATADSAAAYAPVDSCQPDGRIKKGSGALVGNDIYNATGTNQTRAGGAAVGSTIRFTISIQNDGSRTDKFRLSVTGASAAKYAITYFRGSTNITLAVVGGTYQTANVAPGSTAAITAKVKVLSGATIGSSVTRLVTIISVTEPGKVDTVKFTGKRS
jgi:hypothetical protein